MILAMETSSLVCGASLHDNNECIAEIYLKEPRVHAEKLVGLVNQLFEEQKIRVQKLTAVVVSAGPGSFTGLRIGMSFAKGLVYPHQIPLAGVNTMKAFIAGTIDEINRTKTTLWVIRSHKDYIYTALFTTELDDIDIRYGQIHNIKEWYPECAAIICNDSLEEIKDIPVVERSILPSMIGNYYMCHKRDTAVKDYDSLVLEYGMDYKPKEWKPGTA
ncbi:MAG: tRNA (adenosine(37)-N6)-threonylcarbamoyltransferase complex dimerization subunit type 1 TsaB [Candidatus Marinimicrobia bacterium]|nr:tRNA (adenosine(37)-N6)-threonylcarbamoyltransferase complex dimerization subunit type 1 TsaB [Candidatus Neomarinimicrobiota bacterium]